MKFVRGIHNSIFEDQHFIRANNYIRFLNSKTNDIFMNSTQNIDRNKEERYDRFLDDLDDSGYDDCSIKNIKSLNLYLYFNEFRFSTWINNVVRIDIDNDDINLFYNLDKELLELYVKDEFDYFDSVFIFGFGCKHSARSAFHYTIKHILRDLNEVYKINEKK